MDLAPRARAPAPLPPSPHGDRGARAGGAGPRPQVGARARVRIRCGGARACAPLGCVRARARPVAPSCAPDAGPAAPHRRSLSQVRAELYSGPPCAVGLIRTGLRGLKTLIMQLMKSFSPPTW